MAGRGDCPVRTDADAEAIALIKRANDIVARSAADIDKERHERKATEARQKRREERVSKTYSKQEPSASSVSPMVLKENGEYVDVKIQKNQLNNYFRNIAYVARSAIARNSMATVGVVSALAGMAVTLAATTTLPVVEARAVDIAGDALHMVFQTCQPTIMKAGGFISEHAIDMVLYSTSALYLAGGKSLSTIKQELNGIITRLFTLKQMDAGITDELEMMDLERAMNEGKELAARTTGELQETVGQIGGFVETMFDKTMTKLIELKRNITTDTVAEAAQLALDEEASKFSDDASVASARTHLTRASITANMQTMETTQPIDMVAFSSRNKEEINDRVIAGLLLSLTQAEREFLPIAPPEEVGFATAETPMSPLRMGSPGMDSQGYGSDWSELSRAAAERNEEERSQKRRRITGGNKKSKRSTAHKSKRSTNKNSKRSTNKNSKRSTKNKSR